jgi:hypothetical protein
MSAKKSWLNTPKFTPLQVIIYTAGILITFSALTPWYQNIGLYWKIVFFASYSLSLLLLGIPTGKVKEMLERGINIFLDDSKSMDMKLKMLMPIWLILSQMVGAVFDTAKGTTTPSKEEEKDESGSV